MSGRNQEQKTKNHSLGPNTSDEENYQIRKMKTQRASYLRSEGKTQPRRGHTSASHRSCITTISTKTRCQKEIFIELKQNPYNRFTEVTVLSPVFNWKYKMCSWLTPKLEIQNKIGKWRGVPTIYGSIYRLKQKAK
jgi:hypothetical protein